MDGEENTPLLISVHEVGHPNQNHSSPPTALKVLQTSTMFWALGGIYGATAVALGAFGAHGLKKRVTDPQKLATWGTAAHYQVRRRTREVEGHWKRIEQAPKRGGNKMQRLSVSLWRAGAVHVTVLFISCPFRRIILSSGPRRKNIKLIYFLGSDIQLIHSGVLLLTASVAPRNKVAATLFTAGMTMFSGSIYLLVLDPARFKALGPVTPLGGVCLILGWFALALGPKGRVFIGAK